MDLVGFQIILIIGFDSYPGKRFNDRTENKSE